MPDGKLASLRQRYRNSCGYCGVTETSVGSELTVDHFRPTSADGGDDENNLVYACIKCNQFKGNFWPNEEDLSKGKRILHPLQDDLTAHVKENQLTGYLEAVSITGQYHITLLQLNRPQLVRHRLLRLIQTIEIERLQLLEQENTELSKTIESKDRYIALLEARVEELS